MIKKLISISILMGILVLVSVSLIEAKCDSGDQECLRKKRAEKSCSSADDRDSCRGDRSEARRQIAEEQARRATGTGGETNLGVTPEEMGHYAYETEVNRCLAAGGSDCQAKAEVKAREAFLTQEKTWGEAGISYTPEEKEMIRVADETRKSLLSDPKGLSQDDIWVASELEAMVSSGVVPEEVAETIKEGLGGEVSAGKEVIVYIKDEEGRKIPVVSRSLAADIGEKIIKLRDENPTKYKEMINGYKEAIKSFDSKTQENVKLKPVKAKETKPSLTLSEKTVDSGYTPALRRYSPIQKTSGPTLGDKTEIYKISSNSTKNEFFVSSRVIENIISEVGGRLSELVDLGTLRISVGDLPSDWEVTGVVAGSISASGSSLELALSGDARVEIGLTKVSGFESQLNKTIENIKDAIPGSKGGQKTNINQGGKNGKDTLGVKSEATDQSNQGVLNISLFNDKNGNGKKDEGEEDLQVEGVEVTLEKLTENIVYTLLEGWNLVSFPVIPQDFGTASELISQAKDQGIDLTTVAYWDGDRWQEFVQRGDKSFGQDFLLEPGIPYLLRNYTHLIDFKVTGFPLAKAIPLEFEEGWNAVGFPFLSSESQAEDILDRINQLECAKNNLECLDSPEKQNAESVSYYSSGQWQMFIKRHYSEDDIEVYGDNFEIENTKGYFLPIKKPVEFTP